MSSAAAIDDGAIAVARAWTDGVGPEPDLTVSAWADVHRILSPRGANEAGRWRTARTPYLRAIMDALSPAHPAQRIVFMKGAQLGGTEAGNCWIGYVIHHAPGPMLAVQPTLELAKRFSQQRIDPLIDESPVLRGRVTPARARDAGNTRRHHRQRRQSRHRRAAAGGDAGGDAPADDGRRRLKARAGQRIPVSAHLCILRCPGRRGSTHADR